MNLSINELERRLYIEDRQRERTVLLQFVEAWDVALDDSGLDGLYETDPVEAVGFASTLVRMS